MNITGVFDNLNGIAKGAISVLLSLAALALVVDLLFPGTTNIVASVSSLISSFTSQGLIGLIALIVFVSIFSKD